MRIATINVFDPATDLIRWLKNNFDSKIQKFKSKSSSKFEGEGESKQTATHFDLA